MPHEPWYRRVFWIAIASVTSCLIVLLLNAALSVHGDSHDQLEAGVRQWVSATAPFAALTQLGSEADFIPLVVGPLGYVLKPAHSDHRAIHGEIICSSHHHGVGIFELRFGATNRVNLLLKFNDGTNRLLELETTR